MQKFSDDSAVLGLIVNQDENVYRDKVNFCKWCNDNFLLLNVAKTKELVIDYRKKKSSVNPIKIQDQEVEIVDTFKYLGVVIDNKLNWAPHVDKVFKKTQFIFPEKTAIC